MLKAHSKSIFDIQRVGVKQKMNCERIDCDAIKDTHQ